MPFADPVKKLEYQRQWTAARKAEFFRGKSCVRCGSLTDLELDHIDPAAKVSHRIWNWAGARREAELAKCQVLCKVCHEQKSITQQRLTHGWIPYRHGTPSMYKKNCRCGLCRLWKRNYDKKRRSKLL